MDKPTTNLPDRDTFIARGILRCLREWRAACPSPRPWIVTDEDLDALEEWAASLWNAWQDTHDQLERCGFVIEVEQPSRIERASR